MNVVDITPASCRHLDADHAFRHVVKANMRAGAKAHCAASTRRAVFATAALTLVAVLTGPAHAATFTVGAEPDCTHRSIQAAIDAAASNPGADTVAISGGGTHETPGLTIDTDEGISVLGGFARCNSPTAGARSVIGPVRDAHASLLHIVGGARSLVRLRGIDFIGGDAGPEGRGGGIRYDGDGTLDLSEVRIRGSRARLGGGLYADSPAGTARVVIGDQVDLSDNTAAVNGGGLHVSGVALEWQGDGVISGNQADRRGGGVYLSGPSRSRTAPVTTRVHVSCARIEGNRAADGSAVSIGAAAVFIATPRAGDAGCTRIVGNRGRGADDSATIGSALHIAEAGEARLRGVTFSANAGRHMVDADGDLELEDSLLVDNTASAELIANGGHRDDAHHAILRSVTIAANRIGATSVIASSKNLSLLRAIVWQPGRAVLERAGARLDAVDILANERASLGDIANRVVIDEPQFIDPDGADFRLRESSPAIDFSPVVDGTDIAGVRRGVDLPQVPNRFGRGDLGAYEQPLIEQGRVARR